MRAIYLIALREFAENAKTKGFWIGLILFPIMIWGSLYAQKFLNDSTPTRHYILVDQSGEYAEVVRAAMERHHQADVLRALGRYQRKYLKDQSAAQGTVPTAADLERVRVDDMGDMASEAMDAMGDMLGPLFSAEGLDFVLEEMAPRLVTDRPDFEEPRRAFREIPFPGDFDEQGDLDELAKALRPHLLGESLSFEGADTDLFAAILIPKNVAESVRGRLNIDDLIASAEGSEAPQASKDRVGIQYWAGNLADNDLKESVSAAVHEELRRKAFMERHLDGEKVAEVQGLKVPFSSLNPNKEEGKEAVSSADKVRQWAPVGFVYLLWIGIFTISQMLLNNTIEEKSNRIIEVLLSSVTAGELMMGKLLGIAAVGITMIGVWMGSLVVILKLSAGPESELAGVLWEVLQTSGLIPIFMIYFVLGYLLYSAIFLSIGSMCNTLKEAQNLMGPVMLIMMVPMVTMMFIPKDPNGTLARVLSWIPLYTPFTMMNRAAAHPPMVDWLGTGILLLASTALAMFMTGRIFRAGILQTGQPPKLKELLGWLRAS